MAQRMQVAMARGLRDIAQDRFCNPLTGTWNEIADVVVAIFFSTGSIIPT